MQKLQLETLKNPESILLLNKVAVYAFSFFLSMGLFVISIYLNKSMSFTDVFLLYLVVVIASVWYGDVRTGLFSTAITAIGYVYYFVPFSTFSLNEIVNLIPLLLYCTTAALVSFLIDKARKTDEVSKYKLEKLNADHFLALEKKKNEKAHEDIKSRDEFLSIASHELKTPLTLSLLQIQRALHNIRNVSLANFSVKSLMEMLESVEQQTDRLSKLISDLSNVSLITTGRMRLELEDMDLSQVIRDVVVRVPITMRKEKYPLTFQENKEVKGKWDKVRIEQVMTNLLSNAIKYGNDNPVVITLEKNGSDVFISVKDKGLGIAKDIQKKVFNRFERGVNGKEIKGLGIGLYVTNQIVAAHGGKIELKSHPGKGSEFIVKLPVKSTKIT